MENYFISIDRPIYRQFLMDLFNLFNSETESGKQYLELKEIPSSVKQVITLHLSYFHYLTVSTYPSFVLSGRTSDREGYPHISHRKRTIES